MRNGFTKQLSQCFASNIFSDYEEILPENNQIGDHLLHSITYRRLEQC